MTRSAALHSLPSSRVSQPDPGSRPAQVRVLPGSPHVCTTSTPPRRRRRRARRQSSVSRTRRLKPPGPVAVVRIGLVAACGPRREIGARTTAYDGPHLRRPLARCASRYRRRKSRQLRARAFVGSAVWSRSERIDRLRAAGTAPPTSTGCSDSLLTARSEHRRTSRPNVIVDDRTAT